MIVALDETRLDRASKGRSRFGRCARGNTRLSAYLELQNAWYRDDGLRPVSILEQCEFDCFRSGYEQSATETLLFLSNPVAAAVPADKKARGVRTARRGRYVFGHDTAPLMSIRDCALTGRNVLI